MHQAFGIWSPSNRPDPISCQAEAEPTCAASSSSATPKPRARKPGESDRERALTERGRKDAALIGAYMARHALNPGRVAISPSLRTQETWKYAAGAFRPAPAAQTVERLYDATAHAILDIIKDTPGERP